jgi:predicted membrane channel-forming protein YqfA (hemolysin III family)
VAERSLVLKRRRRMFVLVLLLKCLVVKVVVVRLPWLLWSVLRETSGMVFYFVSPQYFPDQNMPASKWCGLLNNLE